MLVPEYHKYKLA